MPYLTRSTPTPESIDCRILTAALDLYVSQGFHNVSVHDVQKKAKVSIGSIYNHFGGKEGIARALYDHLLNEMNEMIDLVLEEYDTAVDRCNRIIELLFEYTETKTNIISYVLHAKHGEFISNQPPICCAEPFRKMRAIVQQGIDRGDIRGCNSWIACSAIFGPAIRMIHLRLDGVMDAYLPDLYEETVVAVWRGMASEKSDASPNLSVVNS
ncbi:MAG: TetR/AcrR family transcriptional regulator [Gammaproteobacteria bacterium]|nr:TetR/AcrR family transcriptional regulator [Gammaproteobacteria bacterium]